MFQPASEGSDAGAEVPWWLYSQITNITVLLSNPLPPVICSTRIVHYLLKASTRHFSCHFTLCSLHLTLHRIYSRKHFLCANFLGITLRWTLDSRNLFYLVLSSTEITKEPGRQCDPAQSLLNPIQTTSSLAPIFHDQSLQQTPPLLKTP